MSDPTELRDLPPIPRRQPDTHKGDYGRVLVIAGSPGMTGAACLAGDAALKAGAGLVTVACPDSVQPVVAAKLTAVMTRPLPSGPRGALSAAAIDDVLRLAESQDALCIGPGLSQDPGTVFAVRRIIADLRVPFLLDADGLNALAGAVEVLGRLRTAAILTPHPGEMARLVSRSARDVAAQRAEVASEFTGRFPVVLCLKGHRTVVAAAGRIYFNRTGNPGMATGGSGDVLAGLGAAYLARRFAPFEAACLAVHLHGLAGDIAARSVGEEGLTAEDILAHVPKAIREYQQGRPGD